MDLDCWVCLILFIQETCSSTYDLKSSGRWYRSRWYIGSRAGDTRESKREAPIK